MMFLEKAAPAPFYQNLAKNHHQNHVYLKQCIDIKASATKPQTDIHTYKHIQKNGLKLKTPIILVGAQKLWYYRSV